MPTDPVSIAVALADKLDMLVGFWAIDEKPTGTKDPYALRRAALGVIRIVLDNGLRLKLFSTRWRRIADQARSFFAARTEGPATRAGRRATDLVDPGIRRLGERGRRHDWSTQYSLRTTCC